MLDRIARHATPRRCGLRTGTSPTTENVTSLEGMLSTQRAAGQELMADGSQLQTHILQKQKNVRGHTGQVELVVNFIG